MHFKQIQIFSLSSTFKLSLPAIEQCSFTPCLPSLPLSVGFVPLWDEDGAPLTRRISNCIIFCAQFEEKILPSPVVRKTVADKIKEIEKTENRKIRQKEKNALKDDIIMTLLPRAFSKFTKIYAYIDTKQQWLILGTINPKKTEQFLTLCKKSMGNVIQSFDLIKPSRILTQWVKEKNYPNSFSVEKACVLQDPNQSHRIIRAQQQNLFSTSILGLIKDGCEVKQLELSWQEQIQFVLQDDFSIRSIQLQNAVLEQHKGIEPETQQQKFDADFMIIESIFSALIQKLLQLFLEKRSIKQVVNIDKKLAVV